MGEGENSGSFPSVLNEFSGRFVGFSEHVGHIMTYKVLTDDTRKVIFRSRIKLARTDPNARLDNQNDDPNARLDNQNDQGSEHESLVLEPLPEAELPLDVETVEPSE